MQKKVTAFEQHMEFYNDLKSAFKEVKEIQEGKKKAKSLTDVINGL